MSDTFRLANLEDDRHPRRCAICHEHVSSREVDQHGVCGWCKEDER